MINIASVLDNDAYKFSMGNMVLRLFPHLNVQYELINRGGTEFPHGFADGLNFDLKRLASLSLRAEEKRFLLQHCTYLDPAFVDFFEGYRYDPHEVSITQEGGDLKVVIQGPWYRTIFWEVLLMAIISEQYFISSHAEPLPKEELRKKVLEKRDFIRDLGVLVADFGTRRRFSIHNHGKVVHLLKDVLIGTSNIYLAMIHRLKAIGTQAHELYMVIAALFGYRMANKITMEKWLEIFRGDLGIALSDTFTTDVFLQSFDKKFAKLFDGVRQDSGDPIEQAEKIVKHYDSLGIDPTTKTIVFSDSLNLDKVATIHEWCKGKIKDAYGIGTFLTNDVGVKPLNFVIKLTAVQGCTGEWLPTVKLSDTPGKHTGPKDEVELCKNVLRIK
jgi:nicotinate phosphoribosyltransferase